MLTFSNITSFFKCNKKILYYTGFFVLLFMIAGGDAFAGKVDPNFVGPPLPPPLTKVQGWMSMINSIMAGIAGLLALFTYLATMFLDPAWLNGSIFGMTKNFKEIWILVSNVVYFIFAFILIWIAFMNIIGKGDKWELKSALPKFIIGVLIVPFSWFFIQFILSISAILTASVITLPINTFSTYESKLNGVNVPNKCIINFASAKSKSTLSGAPSGSSTSSGTGTGIISCSGKISLKDALTGNNIQGAIFGTIATYTYGVINIQDLGTLKKEDLLKIKTLGDLIFKVVFDILFVLIFAILIITLGLVLVVRGVYIWIYIMLSPLFGLLYFFDKKEGGGEGLLAKFTLKEFIALAMVPIYVMAALSFGFLFMSVVANGIFTPSSDNTIKLTPDGNTISIGDKFKLEIIGSSTSGNGKIFSSIKEGANGVMGVIGSIIMQLFSVIILRGAVMAALRTSDITKELTKPIYDFGNKVGGMVAQAPMYAPVFGGQSMQSMSTAANTVSNSFQTSANTKGNKFAQEYFGEFMGGDKMKKLLDIQAKVASTAAEAVTNMQDGFKNVASGQEAYSNTVARNIITGKNLDILQNKTGIDKKLFDAVKNASSGAELTLALGNLNKELPNVYKIFAAGTNTSEKVENAIKTNSGIAGSSTTASTGGGSTGGGTRNTVAGTNTTGNEIQIKVDYNTNFDYNTTDKKINSSNQLRGLANHIIDTKLTKNELEQMLASGNLTTSMIDEIKTQLLSVLGTNASGKIGLKTKGYNTGITTTTQLDKLLK